MKIKTGTCLNQAAISTYIMRTMGIPVVHEYIPQWGTRSRGHDFSAVLNREGEFIDFLGGQHAPGENIIAEQPPKVFRSTYTIQENELIMNIDDFSDIPPILQNLFFIDVTEKRVKVANVEIKTELIPPSKTEYAYLCVFNNRKWIPMSWGKIKRGRAYFTSSLF
jgi:hypothetical protein